MIVRREGDRRQALALAAFLCASAWIVLALTAPHLPIVWDEGDYLFRAEAAAGWFHGGPRMFTAAAIRDHWWFTTSNEGHPAGFILPIVFTRSLFSRWLSPLMAARLGPVTLFSVAVGAVAYRLRRTHGATAALVAATALLTLPRLFAHAHFATADAQLTAWWLLLWTVQASDADGPRKTLGMGVLAGMTAATKFTGWFALAPVALSQIREGRRGAARIVAIAVVALLTFVAVNPPLWHSPVRGLVTHVALNVNRPDLAIPGNVQGPPAAAWGGQSRPHVSLRDYLAGPICYGDAHPYAPWYNTLAWLIVATPLVTLVLGLVGVLGPRASGRDAAGSVRHTRCLVEHWATLMIVRALPGMPPNDGIRLFLPAFGFWCAIAGGGAQRVWAGARMSRRTVATVLTAAFALTAANEARYYPQLLSHYSVLVGGLRGASALGFEPTYWWDALDDEAIAWLNEHTARDTWVAFSSPPSSALDLLRAWGRIRFRTADADWNMPFTWYVVQNRPSMLTEIDERLLRDGQPAYVKYAGSHGRHVPPDLRVPLLLVYSHSEYERVRLRAVH